MDEHDFGGIDIVALINEYIGDTSVQPEHSREMELWTALKVLLTPEQMSRLTPMKYSARDSYYQRQARESQRNAVSAFDTAPASDDAEATR